MSAPFLAKYSMSSVVYLVGNGLINAGNGDIIVGDASASARRKAPGSIDCTFAASGNSCGMEIDRG